EDCHESRTTDVLVREAMTEREVLEPKQIRLGMVLRKTGRHALKRVTRQGSEPARETRLVEEGADRMRIVDDSTAEGSDLGTPRMPHAAADVGLARRHV